MKHLIFMALAFSILTLTSCGHNISKHSLALADRSVTFAALLKDPDAFRGKFVIFGGTIAEAQKNEQGATLEIIQHDLDRRELPDESVASRGRFLAVTPEALSTKLCPPGRLVSVAGEVAGEKVMPVKGVDYTYPVIMVRELHLFPLPNEEFFDVWVPYIR